ncbi:hypothetical protein V8E54_014158 [Elaphomyces granulatus]
MLRWNSLLRPVFLSIFIIHFPATILPLVWAESAHITSHVVANVENDTSISHSLQLEDEIQSQHSAVEQRLIRQQVIGVKKMSDDEGEKFFLEYWSFGDGPAKAVRRDPIQTVDDPHLEDGDVKGSFESWMKNSSSLLDMSPSIPPLSLHEQESDSFLRIVGRQLKIPRNVLLPFLKRDFKCPSGTFNCTSINHPGSCCNNGDTCMLVNDTGLGDVGCCPQGEHCSGVTSCISGYDSCPSSLGGGCCIPGFSCVSGGCALVSTSTVIETLTPSTSSTAASSTTGTFSSSLTTAPSMTAVATTASTIPPSPPVPVFLLAQRVSMRVQQCIRVGAAASVEIVTLHRVRRLLRRQNSTLMASPLQAPLALLQGRLPPVLMAGSAVQIQQEVVVVRADSRAGQAAQQLGLALQALLLQKANQ